MGDDRLMTLVYANASVTRVISPRVARHIRRIVVLDGFSVTHGKSGGRSGPARNALRAIRTYSEDPDAVARGVRFRPEDVPHLERVAAMFERPESGGHLFRQMVARYAPGYSDPDPDEETPLLNRRGEKKIF